MDDKNCILVVDDEADLREILQCNLENAGYVVETAASAEEALKIFSPRHELILLDVMMAGMSGYDLVKLLREQLQSRVPVIFLTAKDTEADVLTGFSLGCDDYISKPFSLHEVLARVAAVLRRAKVNSGEIQIAPLGVVNVDNLRKVVTVDQREVRLSPKEYGILQLLMENQGRIFSREEILCEVWKGDSFVGGRTVDVHIANLRRKLGEGAVHINNRQGYGYCYE